MRSRHPRRATPAAGHALVLLQLAPTSCQIAANAHALHVRAHAPHLGGTSQARRAHARAFGQLRQRAALFAQERVARIVTLAVRPYGKAVGQRGRQILQAVHGGIQASIAKPLLDLGREHALAVHERQGRGQISIARRIQSGQLNFKVGVRLGQTVLHPLRLPHGKLARPRPDDQALHDARSSASSRMADADEDAVSGCKRNSSCSIAAYARLFSVPASAFMRDTGS